MLKIHNDEYLKEFMRFREHIRFKEYYFNKKQDTFQNKYNKIKEKYLNILNEKNGENAKTDFIKFEKYRVENNKFSIETNTNGFLINIFCLLITIIIACFISLNGITDGLKIAIMLMYALLILILANLNFKDNINVRIYDLAFKVLEDIEVEFIEKLEEQQRIEQHLIAQDQVAATSNDRIIDNTQNDKTSKGNGKCVKGFINIIINKRICK